MDEDEPRLTDRKNALTVGIGGHQYTLTGFALLLMLVGIIVPAVKYGLELNDPTPAEILVAVCIALFSAVLFLWILDATSVLPFRSAWVSRSVYGAAIASILGTSVGVYRDDFADPKYPYEGLWRMTISGEGASFAIVQVRLLISYSKSAETYWGFSEVQVAPLHVDQPSGSADLSFVEITELDPEKNRLAFELGRGLHKSRYQLDALEVEPRAKGIRGTASGPQPHANVEVVIMREK